MRKMINIKQQSKNRVLNFSNAIGLAISISLLASGCAATEGAEEPVVEDYITVEVAKVTKEQVLDTHTLYGPIKGEGEAALSSTGSGEVKSVFVASGEPVEKGQKILALKTTTLDRQIAQAKKSVELAQTNLSSAEERYQDALELLEKNRGLLATGAITESQFDQIKAQATPAQRDAAKIQLEQANLQLKQLRDSLSDFTVTAKQSGILTGFSIKVGDFVQMGTPLGKIASQEALTVELLVAESLYVRLKDNTPVTIAVEGVKAPIAAQITEIGSAPAQGSKLFPVKVGFTAPAAQKTKTTWNGIIAAVRFELGNPSPQVALESQVALSDLEGTYVYRVEGVSGEDFSGAQAVRQPVEMGFDNGVWVVITEGLSEGDWVVVAGQQYISADRKVRFVGEGGDQ